MPDQENHIGDNRNQESEYQRTLQALVLAQLLGGAEEIDGNATANLARSVADESAKFRKPTPEYGSWEWAIFLSEHEGQTPEDWFNSSVAVAARRERGE